jgi:predicted GNAT family acetyltransferase
MALNELYAWGGHSFFSGYQLDEGVYFAVRQNGQLVAAAGTHVVAPEYGIAAVGNVYTHPDHRNRGYATACTGAVTAELFRLGCSTVVLNVWQENAPAVHAYEKLGFRAHCAYLEAPAQRKSYAEQIRDAILMRRSLNDSQA